MTNLFKKFFILLTVLFITFLFLGSIHAEELNNTNNDTVITDEIPVKTYTDLYNKINSTKDSVIELNESYKFDLKKDNESFVNGIRISKNLTLIGKKDTYIDGNFIASGLNISSNCTVILKNIVFKNGYSTCSGGALLASPNSNLYIDNCTFHSNMVNDSNGGAIYGLDGTNIEIHNSLFYNNSAIRSSKLPWNVFKSGMGSAICMRIGSNLKLFDSIFKDHIGHVTTILIITWDDVNTNQSTLYVDNCEFENNVAWSNSAIYLDEFGIAEIKNSKFKRNNSTTLGGTVVFDASKHAVVRNCTFEDNVGVQGGAIFISTFDSKYHSNVEVYDSTFTGNYARTVAGALLSKYSTTVISNCKFNDNSAFSNGGAIYSGVGSLKITDSQFTDNSAVYGGALYSRSDDALISKSTFTQNSASNKGGAIFSDKGKITISDNKFNSNDAIYGGALMIRATQNNVVKSTFTKNVASKNGGAIYSDKGIIKITDSVFTSNSAVSGGALLLKTEKNEVIKSSFVKNSASKSGGAIYSNIENVISSGLTFSKNMAPKAAKVYGAFNAKVTNYVSSSGEVKLKIVLTSPWKMPLKQKIKIKLKGYTSKWQKTDSKGKIVFTLPKNKKVTQKTLSISLGEGVCFIKKYIFKDPSKITIPKKVKKHSKLKVSLKNSKTNQFIKKTKLTVKIYTGKQYKKFNVKTNSKGTFKVSMKKFSRGTHKISIYLNNNDYYINKKIGFKIR
ncbi:hypothetical protein [Methanobrevibacter sp.]